MCTIVRKCGTWGLLRLVHSNPDPDDQGRFVNHRKQFYYVSMWDLSVNEDELTLTGRSHRPLFPRGDTHRISEKFHPLRLRLYYPFFEFYCSTLIFFTCPFRRTRWDPGSVGFILFFFRVLLIMIFTTLEQIYCCICFHSSRYFGVTFYPDLLVGNPENDHMCIAALLLRSHLVDQGSCLWKHTNELIPRWWMRQLLNLTYFGYRFCSNLRSSRKKSSPNPESLNAYSVRYVVRKCC